MTALDDMKAIFEKCAYNIYLIGKVSRGRKDYWKEVIYPSFIDLQKTFDKQTTTVRALIREIRPHATFCGELANFCKVSTEQAQKINEDHDLGLTINVVDYVPVYGEWYIYDAKNFCAKCITEEAKDELASAKLAVEMTSTLEDMVFPTQTIFSEETCLWHGRLSYYRTEINTLWLDNLDDPDLNALGSDLIVWLDSAYALLSMAKGCMGTNEVFYETKKISREGGDLLTVSEEEAIENKYTSIVPIPTNFESGKMRPIDPDRLCETCKATLFRPTIEEL